MAWCYWRGDKSELTGTEKCGLKVNGETFFSEQQAVDTAVLLQTAFAGKSIGEDPD